ncbi:MAG: hypothetical protein VYE22_13785 [Myxococcota bacterium]|nr:hypothetical protein [Myxococcota bacterium]
MRASLISLLAALACAGCYRSHEAAAPAVDASFAPCAPPPGGACRRWVADGSLVELSRPLATDQSVRFGQALARDCSALAVWARVTNDGGEITLDHVTRTFNWQGALTGEATPLEGLSFESSAATLPRLARGDGHAAVMVVGEGACHFAPLDLDGRVRGASDRFPVVDGVCDGLAATPRGYSFVRSGETPLTVHHVDPIGGELGEGRFAPPRHALWDRLVYEDGSFLAAWHRVVPPGAPRVTTLQRLDVEGRPLGPEVELGEDAFGVEIVPTAQGPLLVWSTSGPGGVPLRVRPVDRDGLPRGDTLSAPALHAFDVAAAPTPDGDVLLAWIENHAPEDFRLRLQALDPAGAPRGEPNTIPLPEARPDLQVLVAPTGGLGLAIYSDSAFIRAQPLRCVP